MNLRQVSVPEKIKIENALFCIISNSDLGRSGPIGSHFGIFLISQKNKTRWIFCIFFSKIIHQKGLFEKLKKNSIFWCCLGILDIYGRAFLNFVHFIIYPLPFTSGFRGTHEAQQYFHIKARYQRKILWFVALEFVIWEQFRLDFCYVGYNSYYKCTMNELRYTQGQSVSFDVSYTVSLFLD